MLPCCFAPSVLSLVGHLTGPAEIVVRIVVGTPRSARGRELTSREDFFAAPALLAHRVSEQLRMRSVVFGGGQHLQILKAIVKNVAVNMVNVIFARQLTASCLLDNRAVQRNLSTSNVVAQVPVDAVPPTFGVVLRRKRVSVALPPLVVRTAHSATAISLPITVPHRAQLHGAVG